MSTIPKQRIKAKGRTYKATRLTERRPYFYTSVTWANTKYGSQRLYSRRLSYLLVTFRGFPMGLTQLLLHFSVTITHLYDMFLWGYLNHWHFQVDVSEICTQKCDEGREPAVRSPRNSCYRYITTNNQRIGCFPLP